MVRAVSVTPSFDKLRTNRVVNWQVNKPVRPELVEACPERRRRRRRMGTAIRTGRSRNGPTYAMEEKTLAQASRMASVPMR